MSRDMDALLLRNAVLRFAVDGDLLSIQPLKRGHIHDTFVSTWRQGGARRRFLHQRMNDGVFQDIPAVMHNIETVSRQLSGLRKDGIIDLDGKRTVLIPNPVILAAEAGQTDWSPS